MTRTSATLCLILALGACSAPAGSAPNLGGFDERPFTDRVGKTVGLA